jgi:hypothetical protein
MPLHGYAVGSQALRRIARLKEWEVIAQYDRDGIARPDPERGKPTGGPPRPATSMISSRETSRSPLMTRPVAISFTLTSPGGFSGHHSAGRDLAIHRTSRAPCRRAD